MLDNSTRVHLIDTPGFDDTYISDVETMQLIVQWLCMTFKYGIQLSGVIYMHRITDVRFSGSAMRNLTMFKKLCGENAYKSVFLTTTRWDQLDVADGVAVGIAREIELRDEPKFWGDMIEKGSSVFQYQNSRESALSLIHQILSPRTTVVLAIQDEIVNQGLNIDESSVAKKLAADIMNQRKRYREDLEDLERFLEETNAENDGELQHLIEEDARTAENQKKLTETLDDINGRRNEEFEWAKRRLQAQHHRAEQEIAQLQVAQASRETSDRLRQAQSQNIVSEFTGKYYHLPTL